jgi:protein-L-isoaspartate(D-aspartate) O-methyltransferase
MALRQPLAGRAARMGGNFNTCVFGWVAVVALLIAPAAAVADEPARARARMVEEVAAMAAQTGPATGREALDARVLAALGTVPRHRFVPSGEIGNAYRNRPLPIGHGQTISQPYIVALMTDLLRPAPDHVVLELGTGSGYQAAVLSVLVERVQTIEIVEPLAAQAKERLADLGYRNVEVRAGDGYHGWPERGPYDSIMVTAAASHVPPPLLKQLKSGGRMVIPVGAPFLTQHLMLVEKKSDGTFASRQILPVRFVPLTGGH